MKPIRFKLVRSKSKLAGKSGTGRVNLHDLDATTEADIQAQAYEDDAATAQDAALFAPRVRIRLALTQAEFSRRIYVSLDTIRNGEQGKRYPAGAVKALLRVLDRAPEASLPALGQVQMDSKPYSVFGPLPALLIQPIYFLGKEA